MDRLVVIWRDVVTGSRHAVGDLRRADGEFVFCYRDHLPDGFSLLPEFPEGREYRARYPFPTFAQRIPSPARLDRADLMQLWGVENADDPLEVLARSGGLQMTDRLELAEYRPDDDDLSRALETRLSGQSHHAPDHPVTVGQELGLLREPNNAYDPHAVIVVLRDGVKLGYVPRYYSQMVARLLDSGAAIRGQVVRSLRTAEDRLIVRLSRV